MPVPVDPSSSSQEAAEPSSSAIQDTVGSHDPISEDGIGLDGHVEANGSEVGRDDWLMSDDEYEAANGAASSLAQEDALRGVSNGSADPYGHGSGPSSSTKHDMITRDSSKVQRLFYDTGYREGITAGKLSTLQAGFDQGFNMSAPIGRTRGYLRGQINAARTFLGKDIEAREGGDGESDAAATSEESPRNSARGNVRTNKRLIASGKVNVSGRARAGGLRPPTSASSLRETNGTPCSDGNENEEDKENQWQQASSLAKEINDSLTMEQLMEPDWEARRHEAEHADAAGVDVKDLPGTATSESAEQARVRETLLPFMKQRVEALVDRIGI